MVRCTMTMILTVGRRMKWMTTLNIWLMTLKKITYINYRYGSLTQPMVKYMFWRVNIFFYFSQIGWERGVILEQKEDDQKEKISYKGNEGIYFGKSCNRWVDMIACLRGD